MIEPAWIEWGADGITFGGSDAELARGCTWPGCGSMLGPFELGDRCRVHARITRATP